MAVSAARTAPHYPGPPARVYLPTARHDGCTDSLPMTFDAIHIVGYLGAVGSLTFGANQLRMLIAQQAAEEVSAVDYAIRVAYSVLLGIYAIGTGDLVFTVVNFGAAVLSLVVALVAHHLKKR
jgi:hypothetical protein